MDNLRRKIHLIRIIQWLPVVIAPYMGRILQISVGAGAVIVGVIVEAELVGAIIVGAEIVGAVIVGALIVGASAEVVA